MPWGSYSSSWYRTYVSFWVSRRKRVPTQTSPEAPRDTVCPIRDPRLKMKTAVGRGCTPFDRCVVVLPQKVDDVTMGHRFCPSETARIEPKCRQPTEEFLTFVSIWSSLDRLSPYLDIMLHPLYIEEVCRSPNATSPVVIRFQPWQWTAIYVLGANNLQPLKCGSTTSGMLNRAGVCIRQDEAM